MGMVIDTNIMLVIISTMALFSSNRTVKWNTFQSTEGWFKLNYPSHWTLEEEESSTYLFYDNDDWKGSFRITAIRIGNENADLEKLKLDSLLQDQFDQNEDAEFLKRAFL